MEKSIQIALVGNPNTGKTSLFNALTGLRQKTANYPGVTVDKKQGSFHLENNQKVEVIDLPGSSSLIPTSVDESVTTKYLLENTPDLVILMAEVENLKRNLLLFSQVKDLQLPTLLVVNMSDRMALKGISIDVENLKKSLHTD